MKQKLHRDVYIGTFLLILCAAFLIYGWVTIRANDAKLLPCALLAAMCALSVSIIVKGMNASKESSDGSYEYTYTLKDVKEPLIAYLLCFGYLALFWWLGYFAATPIFLIVLMRYLKAGSWKKIILVTLIYTVVIYITFVPVLGLPIHRVGLLGGLFRFG